MTKGEAEKAIRALCYQWATGIDVSKRSTDHPSYIAFKFWCQSKGYGHYFRFRSERDPDRDAERWFYEEFGGT